MITFIVIIIILLGFSWGWVSFEFYSFGFLSILCSDSKMVKCQLAKN